MSQNGQTYFKDRGAKAPILSTVCLTIFETFCN